MPPFPVGLYSIRPINAPEGSLTARPIPTPGYVVAVRVDKNGQVWEVTGQNDRFNITEGLIKPTFLYKWFNKGNALFATLFGSADDFRIESAGNGLWVIGIPNQDLLLTYDAGAYPQLTFRPADGSDAQRFEFNLLIPA